ncbi:MAG: class I SAM-dependent methyltransferase [Blastocatellia bacterium]
MSQQAAEIWKEALLLPGETSLAASALRELAEYFRISPAEAERRCQSALVDSRQEWEAGARASSEQVLDFYDQTESYIFEHVWWHVEDIDGNAVNVRIMEYARRLGATEYLDFGSGVGANALLAARQGLRVTLADVSGSMLAFARWRMERRGLTAGYVYLREQPLPAGKFDFATAMDVMEHLQNPAAEISRVSRALRPGGVFVFNARPGHDPARPMHILPTMYPVYQGLRGAGLRTQEGPDVTDLRREGCFVCRRAGDGPLIDPLINFGWKMYDRIRYSAVAETGSHLLNAALGRRSAG